MNWTSSFGLAAALFCAGITVASAQDNGGSIATNRNTTNSLSGLNNRPGPVVARTRGRAQGRRGGNTNTTNSLAGINQKR